MQKELKQPLIHSDTIIPINQPITYRFKFLWTSLSEDNLPHRLAADILYIIKKSAILSKNRQYLVYWTQQGKPQKKRVPQHVLSQLNFIKFPSHNHINNFQMLKQDQSIDLSERLSEAECKFMPEKAPKILQGPRKKNWATKHLEYIVKSYISDSKSVTFEEKSGLIKVNDKPGLNIVAILKFADFEQIRFTQSQLDQALRLMNRYFEAKKTKNHDYHQVEKLALARWTDDSYCFGFNSLLRDGKIFDSQYLLPFLLNICVAVHALSRPYLTPELPRNLYRGEYIGSDTEGRDSFYSERVGAVQERKLVISKGFFSTSPNKGSTSRFGNKLIYIHESAGLNPLAKDISLFSTACAEQEALIPPNSDMLFESRDDGDFNVTLYRSINREADYKYVNELEAYNEEIEQAISIREDHPRAVMPPRFAAHAYPKSMVLFFVAVGFLFLAVQMSLGIANKSLNGKLDTHGGLGTQILAGFESLLFGLLSVYFGKCASVHYNRTKIVRLSLFETEKEYKNTPNISGPFASVKCFTPLL